MAELAPMPNRRLPFIPPPPPPPPTPTLCPLRSTPRRTTDRLTRPEDHTHDVRRLRDDNVRSERPKGPTAVMPCHRGQSTGHRRRRVRCLGHHALTGGGIEADAYNPRSLHIITLEQLIRRARVSPSAATVPPQRTNRQRSRPSVRPSASGQQCLMLDDVIPVMWRVRQGKRARYATPWVATASRRQVAEYNRHLKSAPSVTKSHASSQPRESVGIEMRSTRCNDGAGHRAVMAAAVTLQCGSRHRQRQPVGWPGGENRNNKPLTAPLTV